MKTLMSIFLALVAITHAATLDFKELSQVLNAPADMMTVTVNYEFTNKSERAITITKCDPGCTCVSVEIAGGKLSYEPGESGSIRAKFDMTNFYGTVDKAILLYLDNDPVDQPSQILKLKVNIPVLVGLNPKTVKWVVGEKPEVKTVEIRIIEGQTIHINDVKSSSPDFTFQLKTLEDGKSYNILITPKDTKSPHIGVFSIKTDCKIAKYRVQQVYSVVQKPRHTEAAADK
jgi:hypothetical protein